MSNEILSDTADQSSGFGVERSPARTARSRFKTGFIALCRKIFAVAAALLVITVITFAATNIHGAEDVARNALSRDADAEVIAAFIKEHGLAEPLYLRYLMWLKGFVTGDWGFSVLVNRSVREVALPWMINTLLLSTASILIALPISVALGLFMARRWGSRADLSLLSTTVVLAATPEFIIGIMLMLFFSIWLRWTPVASTQAESSDLVGRLAAYALPTVTLVLVMVPHLSRIARAAIIDGLRAPFVNAAVLRGLSRRLITLDFIMRNAAIPFVNAVAINIVYLLSGVIVIENVFAFPGVGRLLVEAVTQGDVVVVQAVATVMGALFLSIGLIADLLVIYLNPKLRQGP